MAQKCRLFLFFLKLIDFKLHRANDAPLPVDSVVQEHDNNRRKRGGSGTKVGGAAASAKSATKNSGGNKKNFR